MALQFSEIAAALSAQAPSGPIVVRIEEGSGESWAKWLLPTIIQTVVSLASIIAGVLIARWSFKVSRTREHEQWVRDQRRAEWKDLLSRVAEIERGIPILIKGLPDHERLPQALLDVLPHLRGTIFVYRDLESSGFIAKWEKFVEHSSGRFKLDTDTFRSIASGTLGERVSSEDFVRWEEIASKREFEIRERFHSLLNELRVLAHRGVEVGDDVATRRGHDPHAGTNRA